MKKKILLAQRRLSYTPHLPDGAVSVGNFNYVRLQKSTGYVALISVCLFHRCGK